MSDGGAPPALPPAIVTDALIIGAGPVGLFQVFELGLLELHAEVVDALPHAGGQCAELYPDKPIYDLPGLLQISGRELAQRLQQQCAPFKPGLHLGQLVSDLQTRPDGRFDVRTHTGTRFDAGVVILAAGAGAFLPRELKVPGLETLAAGQLHHRLADVLAPATAAATATAAPTDIDGRHLVVLGDEDEALEGAATLARSGRCASVTLVHRREQFRASEAALGAFQAARASGQLQFIAGQPVGVLTADEGRRLQGLQVITADEQTLALPANHLLPLLGVSPRLGPLADWGLALERRQVSVSTETCETSLPGVYAVGDINTYPGKKKLLVCGFHEATMAAFAAANRLHPQRRQLLQYTTTSPRLHQLLGVAPG